MRKTPSISNFYTSVSISHANLRKPRDSTNLAKTLSQSPHTLQNLPFRLKAANFSSSTRYSARSGNSTAFAPEAFERKRFGEEGKMDSSKEEGVHEGAGIQGGDSAASGSMKGERERGGDSRRGGGGRGGKNGGNRSRGGKGDGGGEGNREFVVSKALSWILRHGAVKEGLELDGEGFARCDQLLQWQKLKSLHVSFPEIQQTVSTNAKQRFTLKPMPNNNNPSPNSNENDNDNDVNDPTNWLIRANQGHSIPLTSSAHLTPITLTSSNIPATVIHGTYYSFWPKILESGGLSRMGRNHVHFSVGLPGDSEDVISGMRGDAEVLIYVDVERCLRDTVEGGGGGDQSNDSQPILWWLSSNNVILTEGDSNGMLPTKYWTKVIGRKGDLGVLWEDGKVVREVPAEFLGKGTPFGKGGRGRGSGRGGGGRGGGKGGGKGDGRGGKGAGVGDNK